MEHYAADELNVEGALAQGAHRALAHQRECLGQYVVQAFAALNAPFVFGGFGAHFLVRELLHLRLKGVYPVNDGTDLLQFALVGISQQFFEYVEHVHFLSGA